MLIFHFNMMEILVHRISQAPKELCDKIGLIAGKSGPLVLACRVDHLKEVVDYYENISEEQFFEMGAIISEVHGHIDEGFRAFGPEVTGKFPLNDRLSKMLWFFRKTGDDAAKAGVVDHRVLGSRNASSDSRFKYPFDILQKIGDYFFVENGNRGTIGVYASNYTKYVEPNKVITVRQIRNNGVLVLLLDGPNATIDEDRIIR